MPTDGTDVKVSEFYNQQNSKQVTAAQVVVGSVVWALRGLKKPRSRDMSARGYALHCVCP